MSVMLMGSFCNLLLEGYSCFNMGGNNMSDTSFLMCIPMGEIVVWGEDENDEFDYHPHPSLQMLVNYLEMPVPICHLYSIYFNELATRNQCHFYRKCHIGKSLNIIF